jgi:acetoin utilization protein AcuC
VYRRPGYGNNHPLAIPRVAAVMDLCAALGWLDDSIYETSPEATPAELARFHDPDYIAAVRRVTAAGRADRATRARYDLGTMANPVFPGLFERAATACGGSIRAAERVLTGGVAFNPAGGTHHGRPDRAHGFCYFNDPVLAILRLLDAGLQPVYYVDLDAHHGDGVEAAFADESRVMTLSIHEAGRWPRTGGIADRAGGAARNLPVPPGFNDSELDYLIDTAVIPLGRRLAPAAVVITCGADGLAGDPLARLELSNGALWGTVHQLVALSPRTVVLGGGGYNPWTVARCWTGLWGTLLDCSMPGRLPAAAEAVLRGLACDLVHDEDVPETWFTTLADPPNPGPVRPEVEALAAAVLAP